MPLKRVPNPNGDLDNWGTLLNAHLAQTKKPTNGAFNTVNTLSQRPASLTADDAGYTCLFTQTGNWHEWNGTGWIVYDQNRVANVRDYGAIGDGAADDTNAITAAINKNISVYFPKGSYKTNQINPKTDNTYYGCGAESVIILNERDLGSGVSNILFYINTQDRVQIKDLKITANRYNSNPAPNAYGSYAVYIWQSKDCIIDNVIIDGFADSGITCGGSAATASSNIIVRNCQLRNWGNRNMGAAYGAITFGSGTNNCTAENNILRCAATFGIALFDSYTDGDVTNHRVVNNVVENCVSYGILAYVQGTAENNFVIAGNTIRNISGAAVSGGVKSFGAGIYAVGCIHVHIEGNFIDKTNLETNNASLAPGNIGIANCKGAVNIINNTCRNSGYYGIYLVGCTDGQFTVNNNIVVNANLETLYCNQVYQLCCVGNHVTKAVGTRTPFTLIDIRNAVVSNNNIFFDSTLNQDTAFLYNSQKVNFTGNIIRSTSTSSMNRLLNVQDVVCSSNQFISANTGVNENLRLQDAQNVIITANQFFCPTNTKKVAIYNNCTDSYIDKSNRLTVAAINNSGTGVTIDV